MQVVGDHWERYLQLLDDGVADGYESLCPLQIASYLSIISAMLWTSLDADVTAVDEWL